MVNSTDKEDYYRLLNMKVLWLRDLLSEQNLYDARLSPLNTLGEFC